MSPPEPISGSASRWYRRLVGLYPFRFRERYGEEMIRNFEIDWVRARERGSPAQLRYVRGIGFDLLRTLPRQILAAAPVLWALAAIVMAGFGVWACFDPGSFCCAALFPAFALLLLLRPSPKRAVILTLAGIGAGYVLPHLLGFPPLHHRLNLLRGFDSLALSLSAESGLLYSFVLQPPSSLKELLRPQRAYAGLLCLGIGIALMCGGVAWSQVSRSSSMLLGPSVLALALHRVVWRGAKVNIGPLIVRHPLNW